MKANQDLMQQLLEPWFGQAPSPEEEAEGYDPAAVGVSLTIILGYLLVRTVLGVRRAYFQDGSRQAIRRKEATGADDGLHANPMGPARGEDSVGVELARRSDPAIMTLQVQVSQMRTEMKQMMAVLEELRAR